MIGQRPPVGMSGTRVVCPVLRTYALRDWHRLVVRKEPRCAQADPLSFVVERWIWSLELLKSVRLVRGDLGDRMGTRPVLLDDALIGAIEVRRTATR